MTDFQIEIKTFSIFIRNIPNEFIIPYDVILKDNITRDENGNISFSLSLDKEYMNIINNFFSEEWFTLNRKDYYRSSDVYRVVMGNKRTIIVKNPVWENNKLISYSDISDNIDEIQKEPKLLLEKDSLKIEKKTLSSLSDFRKKYLK